MTNKEIAKTFQYLADIMELHEESPFRIKSYSNAYLTLRKLPEPLAEMSDKEIEAVKGVGKGIAGKIRELLDGKEMSTLQEYRDKTPPGVQEMLEIPGFGPKKVRVIWKELGADTIGELRYACVENRLVELKGFGPKTQEDLLQKLEYYQKSQGKFLFADVEREALELEAALRQALPSAQVSLAGEVRRRSNTVERIEIVIGSDGEVSQIFENELLTRSSEAPLPNESSGVQAKTKNETPVTVHHYPSAEFGSKLFRHSAGQEFLEAFIQQNEGVDFKGLSEEVAIFKKAKLAYIEPELREQAWSLRLAEKNRLPKLVEEKDIRGVVHSHSTYSDGLHSLREMAEHARSLGYAYLGISDHSKAAFYANGLKEERLEEQWREIEALNAELTPFRIFKGIESDILSDGSLDYEEDYLRRFEFIIASVHSNLRMDEQKATARVLKAVENPFTTILGHPTGRLLLSRQGYPLNHHKIIDACAANKVAIELNANPYRLDLDWTWIPYALEKGVLISINPDAHSTGGMRDIRYGVLSARKGGLSAAQCLTCLEATEFQAFAKKQ